MSTFLKIIAFGVCAYIVYKVGAALASFVLICVMAWLIISALKGLLK